MTGNLSLKKELEIMSTWGLNANQWYLIRCLFINKYEEYDGKLEYLNDYIKKCSQKSIIREDLLELKEKKILDKSYSVPQPGELFDPDEIEFNPAFIKKYFKTSNEAGVELFNAYPSFLVLPDGLHLPARNLTSKVVFKDVDEFARYYCKKIKWDAALHEKVLKGLKFGIEKELIRYGIVEFVVSEKYMDFINLMESGDTDKVFTNIDINRFE